MDYDLIVIGGGPAGYSGAIRASKLGMKTALIERRDLGGTCLNRGCIPTKALLFSAEMFDSRKEFSENGINCGGEITFDESVAYARKQKIVESLRAGIESLIKANGIDLYACQGTILDENTVQAGENVLKTKYILLATGSKPQGFDPHRPVEGIGQTLNSDEVLEKPIEGNNIIIIGGGVIAVEFASYFSFAGKSVTMLVSSDRILKSLSKDISLQLSAVLKRRGIKIITSAKIIKAGKNFVQTDSGLFEADAVVSAVGRKASFDGLGLENVGIKADKHIAVDENMFSGVGGIYACGDITGGITLAHYAAASAITAVESMLKMPHSINLKVCPSCVYTKPEIAVVGDLEINEEKGEKAGKFPMGANGKSLTEGNNRGYIKVATDENGKIKGAEAFCPRATDLIGELSQAVALGISAHEAASVIHPHPTIMEAAGEACEDIFGLATHIK